MRSWGVSLALHGAILGLAATLLPAAPRQAASETLRWEVSFAPATPVPEAALAPSPKPARRQAPAPPSSGPAALPPGPPTPVPQAPPPAVAMPSVMAPEPAARPAEPAAAPAVPTMVQHSATHPEPAPAPLRPAAPPAQARGEAPQAEAEKLWQAALARRLRELRRYPPVARRLGQEGVVLLSVTVAADGSLEGVRMQQGSGYPILDRDALRLLEEAAAAVREEMRDDARVQRPLRLAIPIAYRLES